MKSFQGSVLVNKMIDSHCHINDELYKNNPEEYVKESQKAGVFQFLIVGFDEKSSELALEIANKNESCFAAVGIHPSDAKKALKGDLEKIKERWTEKSKIPA